MTEPTPIGPDVWGEMQRVLAIAEKQNVDPTADPPEETVSAIIALTLARTGLSPRERTATISRIPREVSSRMPADVIDPMLTGNLSSRGFGLSGGAGVGKTFAIAAHIVNAISIGVRKRVVAGSLTVPTTVEWVSWPEAINQIRTTSIADRGLEDVARTVNRISHARVAVIDDIGSERIKGSYNEDWAASQLDLIVDARYRAMLPTFYTTNLALDAFVRRYGQRFYSRLCGENTMIVIPDADDLRIRGRRAR